MTKRQNQIKAFKTPHAAGLEHTQTIDDNPLPDAKELAALAAIDPSILPWMKERAEKEQTFRHSTVTAHIKLVDDNSARNHNTTRMALIIYLVLVAGCMGASYALLQQKCQIEGSIFGGVGIILALAVLVTRNASQTKSTEEVKNVVTNNK